MKSKINNLKLKLSNLQDAMNKLSEKSIENLLQKCNLSEPQKVVINEIISTSKVKLKGWRYSDKWILLCIILNIRYLFIKIQYILKNKNTIRRYLSLIKTKCGFDKKFFKLLKKRIELLNEQARHGMLVFDEILLRESLLLIQGH